MECPRDRRQGLVAYQPFLAMGFEPPNLRMVVSITTIAGFNLLQVRCLVASIHSRCQAAQSERRSLRVSSFKQLSWWFCLVSGGCRGCWVSSLASHWLGLQLQDWVRVGFGWLIRVEVDLGVVRSWLRGCARVLGWFSLWGFFRG